MTVVPKKEEALPLDNEADIYRHLGLEFIAPELRENMGEHGGT